MLAFLLPLLAAADPAPPPVRVDIPAGPPPWVEVAVPVGRVQLTPANGKPGQWLLVDDGADLADKDGAALLWTTQPGRYRVVLFQPDGGFTRLVAVAGKVPPGPPVPPAPPVPPDDALARQIRDAYEASTEPDKADTRANLVALFKVAAQAAQDPATATTADLIDRVAQASNVLIGKDKLAGVRKLFVADLAAAFPEDTALTPETRTKAAQLFQRYAAILSQ